jgi:hypothetical protein
MSGTRYLVFFVLAMLSATAQAEFIRAAGIGNNGGQLGIDNIFANGTLSGSIDRSLTTAQFNALSVTELRDQYDVLLVTWFSDENLNLDWNTRLLPYMQLGGGIIWEDSLNIADLPPGVSAIRSCVSDGSGVLDPNITPVAGLTDGVANRFDPRCHILFNSWDSGLSPFMTSAGYTLALYGEFGAGRIVLGLDNDFHADFFDPEGINHYNLLANELSWVTSSLSCDLNDNGEVDAGDLTQVMRMVVDDVADDLECDINNGGDGDGAISTADLVIVSRIVLGIIPAIHN